MESVDIESVSLSSMDCKLYSSGTFDINHVEQNSSISTSIYNTRILKPISTKDIDIVHKEDNQEDENILSIEVDLGKSNDSSISSHYFPADDDSLDKILFALSFESDYELDKECIQDEVKFDRAAIEKALIDLSFEEIYCEDVKGESINDIIKESTSHEILDSISSCNEEFLHSHKQDLIAFDDQTLIADHQFSKPHSSLKTKRPLYCIQLRKKKTPSASKLSIKKMNKKDHIKASNRFSLKPKHIKRLDRHHLLPRSIPTSGNKSTTKKMPYISLLKSVVNMFKDQRQTYAPMEQNETLSPSSTQETFEEGSPPLYQASTFTIVGKTPCAQDNAGDVCWTIKESKGRDDPHNPFLNMSIEPSMPEEYDSNASLTTRTDRSNLTFDKSFLLENISWEKINESTSSRTYQKYGMVDTRDEESIAHVVANDRDEIEVLQHINNLMEVTESTRINSTLFVCSEDSIDSTLESKGNMDNSFTKDESKGYTANNAHHLFLPRSFTFDRIDDNVESATPSNYSQTESVCPETERTLESTSNKVPSSHFESSLVIGEDIKASSKDSSVQRTPIEPSLNKAQFSHFESFISEDKKASNKADSSVQKLTDLFERNHVFRHKTTLFSDNDGDTTAAYSGKETQIADDIVPSEASCYQPKVLYSNLQEEKDMRSLPVLPPLLRHNDRSEEAPCAENAKTSEMRHIYDTSSVNIKEGCGQDKKNATPFAKKLPPALLLWEKAKQCAQEEKLSFKST